MAESKNSACMNQYWREYFARAGFDIYETIERTIMVAASDYPNEFKIARTLFSCKLIDHSGYDKCENGSYQDDNIGNVEPKENDNQASTYSYREVKVSFDEIDEETELVGEVIRIKGIADNKEDVSQSELYNSLRKLQLMYLPAKTLIATMIGESVEPLQNYGSKDVRGMATILVREWKDTLNGWMDVTENMVGLECNEESLPNNWKGLSCPPLDDFAFVYPQISLPEMEELSTFFDGIDDSCNLGNGRESNKNLRMQTMEIEKVPNRHQKKQLKMMKNETKGVKPNKPPAFEEIRQQKKQVFEVHDLLRQWARKGKRSSRGVHIHDLLRQWARKGKRSSRGVQYIHDILRQWVRKGKSSSRCAHIACPTFLALK